MLRVLLTVVLFCGIGVAMGFGAHRLTKAKSERLEHRLTSLRDELASTRRLVDEARSSASASVSTTALDEAVARANARGRRRVAAERLSSAALAMEAGRLDLAADLLKEGRRGGFPVDHLGLRLERTVRPLKAHELLVNDLDLDETTGRIVSAGADASVRVWNPEHDDPLATLRSDSRAYLSVAVCDGARFVAAGDEDGFACVWDTEAPALVARFDTTGGALRDVALSANGERVATGGVDGIVRLWTRTGELLSTWTGHDGEINGLAIDATGERVLSGSDDATAILWQAGLPDPIHVLVGHEGWIRGVDMSPDGLLAATASDDRTVRIWSLATGATERVLEGHAEAVLDVRFVAGGDRILSSSDDATIRLWDRHVGDVIDRFEWRGATVERAVLSQDGRTVAFAAYDENVHLWARDGATARLEFAPELGTIYALAAHDGRVLVGGSLGKVQVLDGRGGPGAKENERTFTVGVAAVTALAIAPSGEEFAVALANRTVSRRSLEDGSELSVTDGFSRPVRDLRYVGERALAAITEDGEVARFGEDVEDTRRPGPRTQLLGVALSNDGSKAVWADNAGTVRVRSTTDGEAEAGRRIDRLARVGALALSPDGEVLFLGLREGAIARFELTGDGDFSFFVGHDESVTALTHEPSGRQLVSAGRDRSVRVWDAELGANLLTLFGPRSEITALCFDQATGSLVAGTAEGRLFLWPRDAESFAGWQALVQ